MDIKSISFKDLVSFSVILEKHANPSSRLKDYFFAGIRKKILFYAVNQSEKYVHMIRWGEIDHPTYKARIYEREKKTFVDKGEMLPLFKIHQFDKLFKGALNEIDLFEDIGDYHELVEPQQSLRLFNMHLRDSDLTPPTEFKNIEYKHIFIHAKNIEAIEKLLKTQSSPKANKQTRREIVFIKWLKNKEELAVSNMKKDDVWEELRKLDPHLFASEHKNFFRIQKIITFKPGRKLNK
ncbi:hypothetical protein GPUN_0873 [Glaciecola punicea ACAM 611]|uniref:Uncharacterized protein n=1 Tax=Glaciecola punicea ACAM 611 TaxID=1121923 RepID=H5T9M8_9ALTE|nr:hypothetical protein [Glaciecola punicea]GAB55005.1 hypothetical protein GPUN_0873 [Glaciecola punicea ACAM 611]